MSIWGIRALRRDLISITCYLLKTIKVLVPAFSSYGIRINDSLPRTHSVRVRTESYSGK